MAEFFEGIAERDGFLAVDKEGTNFGFSSRGHDVAEDVASGMKRSVVRWLSAGFDGWVDCFVAEIEVAASTASCFGLGKIGCITMDVECHSAGFVADDGVRVGCCVVEEFDNGSGGVIGGVGLGGGDAVPRATSIVGSTAIT